MQFCNTTKCRENIETKIEDNCGGLGGFTSVSADGRTTLGLGKTQVGPEEVSGEYFWRQKGGVTATA